MSCPRSTSAAKYIHTAGHTATELLTHVPATMNPKHIPQTIWNFPESPALDRLVTLSGEAQLEQTRLSLHVAYGT